jgi:hypothetical protein
MLQPSPDRIDSKNVAYDDANLHVTHLPCNLAKNQYGIDPDRSSQGKNSAGRSLAAAAAASTSQMLCGSAGEALGSAWGFSCGSAGAGVASSARTDIGPAAPTAPRIADRSTFARNSEADEARTFSQIQGRTILYPQCIAQIRM